MNRRTASTDGFTLIEVLVALAILSISLTVLLGVFSTVLRRTAEEERDMQARVLAQSLLAGAAARPPANDVDGKAPAGLEWHLHVVPYAQHNEESATLHAATVSVTVSWQDGNRRRALTLSTLEPVPREPPP